MNRRQCLKKIFVTVTTPVTIAFTAAVNGCGAAVSQDGNYVVLGSIFSSHILTLKLGPFLAPVLANLTPVVNAITGGAVGMALGPGMAAVGFTSLGATSTTLSYNLRKELMKYDITTDSFVHLTSLEQIKRAVPGHQDQKNSELIKMADGITGKDVIYKFLIKNREGQWEERFEEAKASPAIIPIAAYLDQAPGKFLPVETKLL